jgi:hypothetical protein
VAIRTTIRQVSICLAIDHAEDGSLSPFLYLFFPFVHNNLGIYLSFLSSSSL